MISERERGREGGKEGGREREGEGRREGEREGERERELRVSVWAVKCVQTISFLLQILVGI